MLAASGREACPPARDRVAPCRQVWTDQPPVVRDEHSQLQAGRRLRAAARPSCAQTGWLRSVVARCEVQNAHFGTLKNSHHCMCRTGPRYGGLPGAGLLCVTYTYARCYLPPSKNCRHCPDFLSTPFLSTQSSHRKSRSELSSLRVSLVCRRYVRSIGADTSFDRSRPGLRLLVVVASSCVRTYCMYVLK